MARVALVTGGSRGIGAAISLALQAAGCKVAALRGNDAAAASFKASSGIAGCNWKWRMPRPARPGSPRSRRSWGRSRSWSTMPGSRATRRSTA